MAVPRYLYRFTSLDEQLVVTMPLRMYEWSGNQDVRNAFSTAIGADYVHDHHVRSASPVDVANETIRGFAMENTPQLLDDEIANVRALARRIGLGKLWTKDADNVLRWAYARVTRVPEVRITVGRYSHAPLVLEFARISDWFESSKTTGSVTINANPTNFNISNPGNLPAQSLVFRLISNGANGFDNPTLLNLGNSHEIGTSRVAADSNAIWRVDTEQFDVEYSTDAGNSYDDDFVNFNIGDLQIVWMKLEPSTNSFEYSQPSGTPNATLEWEFYPPWSW